MTEKSDSCTRENIADLMDLNRLEIFELRVLVEVNLGLRTVLVHAI